MVILNMNKEEKKGDKMNLNNETVEFDLHTLSLQELVEVYKNITEFLDFLQENKISLEDK